MKFILYLEDDGYQIRFWDEICENMGDIFVRDWNHNRLYKKLVNKGFQISKRELMKAFRILEREDKPFVVLKSEKGETEFDTLRNDNFVVDEELTNGDK